MTSVSEAIPACDALPRGARERSRFDDWPGQGTLSTVLLAVALWLAGSIGVAANLDTPLEVVARLEHAIVDAMQNAPAFDERFERMAAIMDESFDFPRIARLALGRHWRDLDDAQRMRFRDRFRELSIATFTGRFADYRGERFEPHESVALPRGGTAVTSLLTRYDGTAIEFEYHMQRSESRWRIVNILVDGVSDLALKRAEYNSVMQERGFGALLEELERQTAAFRDVP